MQAQANVVAVEDEIYTGHVRKTVPQGGYGFIVTDVDPTTDIFFHRKQVKGLKKGDKLPKDGSIVRFQVVPNQDPGKRHRAINVEVL